MGRPFKGETAKKHDRIIAKVYEQLYRWGFSSSVFEPFIANAAHRGLGRGNKKEVGNDSFYDSEDTLSVESVKKIYEAWSKDEKDSYFARINYRKNFLASVAPKEEHLADVVLFLMTYMNEEPEQCIFKSPPKCPESMLRDGIWWRFYNGELDGDPAIASKAIKRQATYPSIKKRPQIPPKVKK